MIMAKEIVLFRGEIALVDDLDYEWLSRHSWHLDTGGYAVRSFKDGKKVRGAKMHREILKAPTHLQVDHIDHNKLNNQRANLRLVTASENKQNTRGARSDSGTGVRGVIFRPQLVPERPYIARLFTKGKWIHLGCFATLDDADSAAKEGRRLYMTHAPENRANVVHVADCQKAVDVAMGQVTA